MSRLAIIWTIYATVMGFALGGSFVSAITPLSEIEKARCYHGSDAGHYKADECKTFWERSTTDPVALYTFGVFIFTGVLAVSTAFLWDATTRAAKTAERTLTDLERPWIFVHLRHRLQNRAGYEDRLAEWRRKGEVDPLDEVPIAIFDLANHGRMPGTIDGCWINIGAMPLILDDEGYPLIAPGIRHEEFFGTIGPQDKRTDLYVHCPSGQEYGMIVDLPSGDRWPSPEISPGENFIFDIVLRYVDVAGRTHTSHFCWRYDPVGGHWVQFGGNKYNYQN